MKQKKNVYNNKEPKSSLVCLDVEHFISGYFNTKSFSESILHFCNIENNFLEILPLQKKRSHRFGRNCVLQYFPIILRLNLFIFVDGGPNPVIEDS